MPTITRLAKQKKRDRVNVYLDGKYAFSVSLEVATEKSLKPGKLLNEKDISALTEKDLSSKLLGLTFKFASSRPHSKKEIKDYLRRKKIDEVEAEQLLAKLTKYDLLNDEKFARWWIEQRTTFKNKSKRELFFELTQKGIPKETIEKASASVETPTDEAQIKTLLVKKFAQKDLSDSRVKQKVIAYFLRKGFPYNKVKDAIDEYRS